MIPIKMKKKLTWIYLHKSFLLKYSFSDCSKKSILKSNIFSENQTGIREGIKSRVVLLLQWILESFILPKEIIFYAY